MTTYTHAESLEDQILFKRLSERRSHQILQIYGESNETPLIQNL